MNKRLINWMGLLGVAALISYAVAVIFSPLAYPGYNWMEQAVSDLSALSAPSIELWNRLSAVYGVGSVVSATCVAIYISESKKGSRLFRLGIYLFTIMNWISAVGYKMFALSDAGKDIAGIQEVMHMIVTAGVVLLSIVSLVLLIIAGFKDKSMRGVGIWALVALLMMFAGPIGMAAFPPEVFGVFERFSTFAAVGYNAVLGVYLFNGFKKVQENK
ncbi:MAG: DUF998 domain-containing protein [Lachnospiraceae bacterium]|nr:DUF998 domain-containing protein [Lachnospiraceae bacterium]